jgi:predicted KAP-like P-loop ATPase
MPSQPRQGMLSADRPLTDPAADLIGRARFARHIANSIALAPAEGMVLGLHGGAGSGKTTVANFVRAELAESPSTAVIEFNPWLYAADDDLGACFLSVLAPAFAGGEAPRDAHGADLPALRDKLAQTLRDQRMRFVVVIDDIDRIPPQRRSELTRLVKLVAALPNVIYLMVFDRSTVDSTDVARLVQVPFDLPLPESGGLSTIFLDHLRELLERYPAAAVVTEHHWKQIFTPGIEALMQTPRDVARFVNVLRLSYPPVSAEVNTADFIAVEALRIFLPALYELIRSTPERFAGATRARTALTADSELQEFHDAWIQAVPVEVRLSVITLIVRLFPAVPDQPGLIINRDPPGENTRQELRIATPELFSIYFQFVVPGSVVSNADMDAYMADAGDKIRFGALLTRLAGERDAAGVSRMGAVLERMRDISGDLDRDSLETIVATFLNVGDELGLVRDRTARDLIWALLGRMDERERFALLSREIAHGRAISTGVWVIAELGLEHGHGGAQSDMPEDERLVTLDHLVELEQVGLRRIRDAARSDQLLGLPALAMVLSCWQVWDRAECVKWVSDQSESDEALIAIVAAHMVRVRDRDSDLGTHGAYRLDPETIRPLISPDVIIHRIRQLARDGQGGDSAIALDQFVVEYELRQAESGK